MVSAYARGWLTAIVQAPAIRGKRRQLRRARRVDDDRLFDDDRLAPPLLTLHNAPVLTSEVIRTVYRPLIENGLTRRTPEWPTAGRRA